METSTQKQTNYGISEQQLKDIDNRFTYHTPKHDQTTRYAVLRAIAKEYAKAITRYCPNSREKSLAITKLEESVMWANASIARNENAN